jgi:hypothetical protein
MTTIFIHPSLLLLFLDPISGMVKNQDPGSGINTVQLLQFYLNGGGAGVEECEDGVEILEAGVRQHEVKSSILEHQKHKIIKRKNGK